MLRCLSARGPVPVLSLACLLIAICSFCLAGTGAENGGITINGARLVVPSPQSRVGLVEMTIENRSGLPDRLLEVSTPVALLSRLYGRSYDAAGVERLLEIGDGLPLPANTLLQLDRDRDQIVLTGLKGTLLDDVLIQLTLRFERAGDIVLTVPVNPDGPPLWIGAKDPSGMRRGTLPMFGLN